MVFPPQLYTYWPPVGEHAQYGNIIVEVENESEEHFYTKREIKLTNAKVVCTCMHCSIGGRGGERGDVREEREREEEEGCIIMALLPYIDIFVAILHVHTLCFAGRNIAHTRPLPVQGVDGGYVPKST